MISVGEWGRRLRQDWHDAVAWGEYTAINLRPKAEEGEIVKRIWPVTIAAERGRRPRRVQQRDP